MRKYILGKSDSLLEAVLQNLMHTMPLIVTSSCLRIIIITQSAAPNAINQPLSQLFICSIKCQKHHSIGMIGQFFIRFPGNFYLFLAKYFLDRQVCEMPFAGSCQTFV